MNFSDRNPNPTFAVQDIYSATLLNNKEDSVQRNYVYLREHEAQTHDSWVTFLGKNELHFFEVGKQIYRPLKKVNEEDKDLLAQTKVFFMNEKLMTEREVYGYLDLLGDLGGVTEIMLIFFGFILLPISEFSFQLAAAEKFFIVRTKDAELFEKP